MPRVKRGVMTHKRHKKIIRQAEGYYGAKNNLFQTAKEAVRRSGNFAYRDRRNKKRDFRRLWIARISAGCRADGTTYSRFINALMKAGIEMDRKVLSAMAIDDPDGFSALIRRVGLDGNVPAPASSSPALAAA